MRNAILSSIWALVGGYIAFYACTWIGFWTIQHILFPGAKIVIGKEIDFAMLVAIPLGLLVACWCTRLFYAGKLPGYRPEK